MSKEDEQPLSGLVRVPLDRNLTGQGILLVTLGLLCLGVVMVHSAVATAHWRTPYPQDGTWQEVAGWLWKRVDVKHLVYALAAAILLMTLWRLNVRWLNVGRRFPWLAAGFLSAAIVLCCMVYVPGVGRAVGDRWRWIGAGPLTFQPSEILKIALVVFLTSWLTRKGPAVRSFWKCFLPALGIVAVCMGIVVKEDFGTAMLIGVAGGVTLLLAGTRWWHLVMLVALAAGGFYVFIYLNPDRRYWDRVMGYLGQGPHNERAVYQTTQSLLAVATGGWWGKGLGMGTVKLGYLPEDSTDFLFAIICEELGFAGAALVLGLVLVWALLARRASARAGDRFGSVLAGALGFLIALQAVLHMAVDLVVVPPKGLGMPFVSAGGTSLIIMAAAASMIVSVTSRRPREQAPALDAKSP
jgi:cell division protein FtsW